MQETQTMFILYVMDCCVRCGSGEHV